jgi:mannosyl-oligosaccharide alpha-1,2-mannosidase
MAGVEGVLVRESAPSKLLYIAERLGNASLDHKMDHLVCFVPGMLALGSRAAPTRALAARHLALARRLLETCVRTYEMTATGLAPEITRFAGGGDPQPDAGSRHNLLRPETVESLFVLWRLTGEQRWRDAGWAIFSAFNAHCRVPGGGFSSIGDVTALPAPQTDAQESFWLAETLKYLWLLFADSDVLPLDRFVFNTEAHPLPVFGSVQAPVSGWEALRAAHPPPASSSGGGGDSTAAAAAAAAAHGGGSSSGSSGGSTSSEDDDRAQFAAAEPAEAAAPPLPDVAERETPA